MKDIHELTIRKTGINGEGIAYLDHQPVFIPGALEGETVSVRIIRKEKNYARGELLNVIVPSAHRITPACQACEGCALNHADEEAQLKIKKDILTEALAKYAHLPSDLVRPVHTDHIHAGIRSQCKLPVQKAGGLLCAGMYAPGTNHFIPVENCPMQSAEVERIRREVLNLLNASHAEAYDPRQKTGLRYLIIRSIQHHGQCTLVTGNDTVPMDLVQKMMKIKGLDGIFQSINTDPHSPSLFGNNTVKLAGDEVIHIDLHGLSLRLSPRSFFQLNTAMAEKLYETAIGKIDPCQVLVEAYCGVGAMSLLAHAKADTVIGIENVPEAIRNARMNASDNHIENVQFYGADAAAGLQQVLTRMPVDTLLADPPRAGMDEAMLETILSSTIRKIIYVSCNPATLAKNLHVLARAYHPVTIIPFDLFPDTPHVESITVLIRNGMHDSKKKKYRKKKNHAVSVQSQGKQPDR
jgi:23S rRNA (uracil1939-C5)-methyltransferase